jgi:hypothetical protein
MGDRHRPESPIGLAGIRTLKAVLLHDRSYVPADGTTDTTALAKWHKQLSRKPYGHDLQRLLAEVVGPEGARYLPQMPAGSVVVNGWTETMRYWAPGAVNEADANTFQAEAGVAIATVLRMKQDGVL